VHGVAVFGSTGSIGQSTLDLIGLHPERFRAEVLTAHRQVAPMLRDCERFKPRWVVMTDADAAQTLQMRLHETAWGGRINVLTGPEGLVTAATVPEVDTMVAGIVGAAGLASVLAAARAGKKNSFGQQRGFGDGRAVDGRGGTCWWGGCFACR